MANDAHFEVASGAKLREKYGLVAENRPYIILDAAKVPEKFHAWIPLAERWGIGDDLIREDCVEKATIAELGELLEFGDAYDDILDDWLAGPESAAIVATPEYVAFTCLGMAFDLAQFRNEKNEEKDRA